MSGDFRPEQNTTIESTDDAALARQYGLTNFNRETGLWTAPVAPDAGQRDGTDVPGHVDYAGEPATGDDDAPVRLDHIATEGDPGSAPAPEQNAAADDETAEGK